MKFIYGCDRGGGGGGEGWMAWGVSEWMLVLVMDERQRDARRCGDEVQYTFSASGGVGGRFYLRT